MKFLLLLTICCSTILSFGQSKKFTFKLGSEFSLPKKSDDLSFLGNEKNGIVNLSLKKENLYISGINPATLEIKDEILIALTHSTKNFNSEAVLDFGGNYFWLHSDWDKGSQKEMLYYDIVDVVNGKLITENNKIMEVSKIAGELGASGFFHIKTGYKYNFEFDASKTKLLINYRLKPEAANDKENYDRIGIYVFDEKMNKQWGNEFTMPYTEAIMDNSDFSIDSKGNAYMLAKIYDSDKRTEIDKETGKAAYHYELFKFSGNNKQIIHTTISIDDYFIKDPSLIETSLHEMIIAGVCSKHEKGTIGIFLSMMDSSGKINKYRNGYYELLLDKLEKNESETAKRKEERKDISELPDLKVRNVLIENDGSLFIVCEKIHIQINSYSSGSVDRVFTLYFYEDIICTRINAANKVEWTKKIPKKQCFVGQPEIGFKLISDETGYYFLFLDNTKNKEKENDPYKYRFLWTGGRVMAAHADNKGVTTKETIFDAGEEYFVLFPSNFIKINGNQFIGRAKIKDGYKPLLITVK